VAETRARRLGAELVLEDVAVLDAPTTADSFAAATGRQLVLAVPEREEAALAVILAGSGEESLRVVGRGRS
jgi:hypothetical protein